MSSHLITGVAGFVGSHLAKRLIKEGNEVKSLKRILEVPVGDAIVGRVVNSLGHPLDGKGEIQSDGFYPIEKIAPAPRVHRFQGVVVVTDPSPTSEPVQSV